MQEVPDWIKKHIQDARELFGLSGAEWHIFAKLSDKPGEDSENSGFVSIDSVYLNATIEMADNIIDDKVGQAEIYHEVLHIAHEHIDHLVDKAMQCVPKSKRKIYRAIYREEVETFIQQISRSIVYRIKRSDNEP